MSHLTSFLRKTAGRALSLHPLEARVVARIAIDDRLIPYMFADPRLPLRLSAEHSLRRDFLGLVGDDRLLGMILDDPLLSERIYLSEPARRQLQSNPRMQRFLLTDAKIIEAIAGYKEIAAKLAQNPQWREWLLEQESFQSWAAENSALFNLIVARQGAIEKITRNDQLMNAIIRGDAAFQRFIVDDNNLARLIREERVIKYLLAEPHWPATARAELIKRLDADPAVLDEFINDERFAERFYQSDSITRRIRSDKQLFMQLAGADSGFAAICNDKPLLNRILTSAGIHEIVNNERLLDLMFGNNRVFERLLNKSDLIGKMLWHEKVLDQILSSDALLFKIISSEPAWARIVGDDQFLLRLASHERVFGKILADEQLLTRLVSNERAFGKILADDLLLTKLVSNGRVFEKVLADEQLLTRLVSNERAFGKILADDLLLTKLVSNGRVFEKVLADEQLLTRLVSNERAFGKILADDLLLTKLVSNGRVFEKVLADEQLLTRLISNERVFRKILADEVLLTKFICNDRAIGKILADDQLLTQIVSNERVFGKILADDVLLTKLVSSGRAIEKILGDPRIFSTLLGNERAAKNILADEAIHARILAQPKLVEIMRQNAPLLGRIVLNEQAVRGLMADPAIIGSKSIDALLQAHAEFRRLWRALEPFIDTTRAGLAGRLHESLRAITKSEDIPERLLDIICEDDKVFLNGAVLAFPDRFSLWTELNEILVDEDYYFECDTAEPRILDCGTNFGLAVYYFKRLYPKARVTGFEPVPALHRIAKMNARDNKMSGVVVHRCAISAEAGQTVFYESKTYPMAGSLTTRRRGFGDTLNEIQVECKPLSAFLDAPVDFLKLDIEGSEDAVLAEAADKLHLVNNMFVEYHHGSGMPDGRLESILRTLEQAGFEWQLGKSFHFGRQSRRRALTCSGQPFSLNIWAKKK